MDILNFISWIKGGRVVTTVDPAKTLLPVGLKDDRRDDGYLAGTISVADFAAQVAAPKYKVYTALLSQSGTSNPTVIVLENTIGTVTVTRNSAGVYYLSSSAFNGFSSNNKVVVFLLNGQSTTGLYQAKYVPPISTVQLASLNTSNIATDSLLDSASIEIRVYP